jgi:hypothetical protein
MNCAQQMAIASSSTARQNSFMRDPGSTLASRHEVRHSLDSN